MKIMLNDRFWKQFFHVLKKFFIGTESYATRFKGVWYRGHERFGFFFLKKRKE